MPPPTSAATAEGQPPLSMQLSMGSAAVAEAAWRESYDEHLAELMNARLRILALLQSGVHVVGLAAFDLHHEDRIHILPIRLAALALLSAILVATRWQRARRWAFQLSVVPTAITMAFLYLVVPYWGFYWTYVADYALSLVGAAVLMPYRVRQMAIVAAAATAAFLPSVVHGAASGSEVSLAYVVFYGGAALAIAHASCWVATRRREGEHRAQHDLAQEQQRGEELLLNILPARIAARLKRSPRAMVDGFDEVTVLFADIVGFTPLGERISPTALVDFLNDVFARFDRLTQQFGLEKIKTIGDAYMVAAGLPEPRDDHAAAAAQLALAMQREIATVRTPDDESLRLRIGMSSGPVVAGVIGTHKFIYDLWGDAVNTASRMESHGEVGTIQVCPKSYHLLRQDFALEERGPRPIKGKGEMVTYRLVGPREA